MPARRALLVLGAAALIGGLLAACTSVSPTSEQRDAAARDRPAALAVLAGASVHAPAGSETIGDRTDDRCGSLTEDAGGLDDRHITGYECVAVRRVLLISPGSETSIQPVIDVATAFLALNGYPAGEPQQSGDHWGVQVPFGKSDATTTSRDRQLFASVVPTDSLIAMDTELPQYPVNGTTVSHTGALGTRSLQRAEHARSGLAVLITIRVRYFTSYPGP